MSEVKYTTVGKKHYCKMWNIDITLTAKYYFFDESNPFIGKYVGCTCPILENLRLPPHKQNPNFSLYRFCNNDDCLVSVECEPTIDIS